MYFFFKMSEMLFNTPVKVHLYLKVYSFHVFLSFYSSLSGLWGVGGTSVCSSFMRAWALEWSVASGKQLSALSLGSCHLEKKKKINAPQRFTCH